MEEPERFSSPRLLPDGKGILFSVRGGGSAINWDSAQIVVQSVDPPGERRVVWNGSAARYVSTGHLIYALDDDLFAIAFDLETLEASGTAVSLEQGLARATFSDSANYGVSDDGMLVYRVAAGTGGIERTLVWVDREGAEEAINVPPRGYVYGRLSPDGTRLALDIRDQESDIWVWDLLRETLSPLTLDPGVNRIPIWSPDGERLAFTAERDGEENIYWQSADGTGEPQLLAEGSNLPIAPHAFSPDGTQLLFTQIAPPRDISLIDLNDGEAESLLAAPYNEFNPVVSPNGRWVALDTDESGRLEVYVRPFPDVGAGRFLISTGGGSRPLWSQDGRELFYLETPGRVMAVRVDDGPPFTAGAPQVVVDGDYLVPNAGRTYDVSLDGQRFLMIKDATAVGSDVTAPLINIVLNWTEELKERVPVP